MNDFSREENCNGEITMKIYAATVEEHMQTYDSLPKSIRDLLKYSFISMTVDGKPEVAAKVAIKDYVDYINETQRESTLATYGPDHPQVA